MAEVPSPSDAGATLERLLSLYEPARRDLYFFVADQGGWVSRDEAAEALGLRRGLVAHHLDRLADDGLLEVDYQRLTGRTGPGAGRPAKLYRRAPERFEVTIPPRNPALVSRLLLDALARAGQRGDAVRDELLDAARDTGRRLGDAEGRGGSSRARRARVAAVLERLGYAPHAEGGELSLANCPYEPLAAQDRSVVCAMNLALVEGTVDAVGLAGAACWLETPDAGRCCVHVAPWPEG